MSTPSDSTTSFATSTGPRGSKALIGVLKSWPNPAFHLQSSPRRPKWPHPLLLWNGLSSLPPAPTLSQFLSKDTRLWLTLRLLYFHLLTPPFHTRCWQPSPMVLFSYSMISSSNPQNTAQPWWHLSFPDTLCFAS